MVGTINLKSFTAEQVRTARVASSCHRYMSPVISEAPERIARLAGYADRKEMTDSYESDLAKLRKMRSAPPRLFSVYLSDPDNYQKTPQLYQAIEVTMDLIFGPKLRECQGVQLAANYGPFLDYLRNKRGVSGLIGIDIDPAAVQYAAENGLSVIRSDVRDFPFPDSSQDIVISGFFLDPWYLRIVADVCGYGAHQERAFMNDVLREAYRVLKPGGCLISLHEWFVYKDERETVWPSFCRTQYFSEEAAGYYWALEDIAVLQKPF